MSPRGPGLVSPFLTPQPLHHEPNSVAKCTEVKVESHSVMSDSCDPMDCSPSGSSVCGMLQARMLEWVAISFSSRLSQPRDWTQVSHIAGRVLTVWATREACSIQSTLANTLAQLYMWDWISCHFFSFWPLSSELECIVHDKKRLGCSRDLC